MNDKAIKHFEEAFRLISNIPVAGDNVEIMAAAKNELRAAYRELKEEKSDG